MSSLNEIAYELKLQQRPKSAPKLDLTLIDARLAHLRAHPELHNQRTWMRKVSCGTACCLAGDITAATMPAGSQIRWYEAVWDEPVITADWFETPEGQVISIEQWATDRAGLLDTEARVLFDEDNTIDDLDFMRDLLALGFTFGDSDDDDTVNIRERTPEYLDSLALVAG